MALLTVRYSDLGNNDMAKRGEIGCKLSTGEFVETSTGRLTTPFPKVSCASPIKASNTVKRVDAWLCANAIAEAESRGDEFVLLQFRNENPAKIPPATKDSMEEYLFG